MASNMWTSDRRIYLTKDGKPVEAGDPNAAQLLVAAGGQIPLADAEKYGLVTVTPAVIESNLPPLEEEQPEEELPEEEQSESMRRARLVRSRQEEEKRRSAAANKAQRPADDKDRR